MEEHVHEYPGAGRGPGPRHAPESPRHRGPRSRQDLPEGGTRSRRAELRGSGGHDLRAARPQRRREVHHRQDPHHPGPGRFRVGQRGRPGRARPGCRGAPRHRGGRPAIWGRPDRHWPGKPAAVRAHPGPAWPPARPPGRRAAGPVRPGRGRGPDGPDLLGWHAAPARRGHGPDSPARGAVPGRANRRPGPGVALRDVGGDRPAVRGRGPHHPADHALPGGGRPAGQPAGHRRARPGGGVRQPGRAESPAARRHRACRAGRPRGSGAAGRRAGPRPGGPRGQRDRNAAERPRRRWRDHRARPADRARAGRDRGARDHRRPPHARRRVPAVRRATFRRGRGRAAGPAGSQPAQNSSGGTR